MYKKLLDKINNLCNYVSVIAVFGVIILSFLQVLARFVFSVSAPWTEELAKTCFLWMCLLSIGYCVITDGHPTMSMLPDTLRLKGKKKSLYLHGIIIQAACLIVMTTVILVTYQILGNVGIQKTPILKISYTALYSSFVIGGIICDLNIIYRMIDYAIKFKNAEKDAEGVSGQ